MYVEFTERYFDQAKHPAGSKDHIKPHEAEILIATGQAKPATVELPPAVVTWSVGRDEISNIVTLRATCSRACGNLRFTGSPELLHRPNYGFFHGCLSQPEPVPKDVIERYSSMRSDAAQNPVAAERRETLSIEDAERMSNSASKQLDGARLAAQIAAEGKALKAMKKLGY